MVFEKYTQHEEESSLDKHCIFIRKDFLLGLEGL
jgi:hypothetical protein